MALEKIDIETLDPAATIVVATGNAHKLTEIEAILGKVMPEVRFVALGQLGDFEDASLRQYYNEGVDAENRKDYEKALYDYTAAGDTADAADRLLNLQGQIYNRAIELREARSYEEAIYLFTLLGDYLSSARQAVECEQIFRDEQYAQADALESSGNLQEAYDLFSMLTGFRDAAQRASDLASRLGIQDTGETDNE